MVSATQGDSQLVGSSQGEVSCSETPRQLGGAGDRTSNLPVTIQPALPPEPLAAHGSVVECFLGYLCDSSFTVAHWRWLPLNTNTAEGCRFVIALRKD